MKPLARSPLFQVVLGLGVMLLAGCGGGSDAPPSARAAISILIDGKPAPAATKVKVSPMGKGQPVLLETNAEGVAQGLLVVGENAVSIVSTASPNGAHGIAKEVGIGKAFGGDASPLRVTVSKDGSTKASVDVGAKQPGAAGSPKTPGSHRPVR